MLLYIPLNKIYNLMEIYCASYKRILMLKAFLICTEAMLRKVTVYS